MRCRPRGPASQAQDAGGLLASAGRGSSPCPLPGEWGAVVPGRGRWGGSSCVKHIPAALCSKVNMGKSFLKVNTEAQCGQL